LNTKSLKGLTSKPSFFEIEKGAIRDFAKSINETNKIYFDEATAKEKGFSSLVAPITFPTTFRGDPPEWFKNLDKRKLLHGEQEYTYKRRLVAGEKIKMTETVEDVFEKQGENKILTFIIRVRKGYGTDEKLVFEEKTSFIIRE